MVTQAHNQGPGTQYHPVPCSWSQISYSSINYMVSHWTLLSHFPMKAKYCFYVLMLFEFFIHYPQKCQFILRICHEGWGIK